MDVLNEPPAGSELRMQYGNTKGSNWIRNIFPKNFKTTGWMNAVAFNTG
jgi:hypothetical protein